MDKINKKIKPKLEDFAPFGTKNCEMKCNREVVMTKTGPVVVCHGCNRIVIQMK